GPFGAGNRRPTFVTRGARPVGLPTIDTRNGDVRFRVVHGGVVLPARLRGGARHFETVRGLRDGVDLLHSPRLAARGEEGPVELTVWQLHGTAPDGSPLHLP